jgi:hypothetical protein
MVSWWPGDGNADDIVGGNNGTLQGGTTFASGEVGQAFSFDGTGYVDASDSNLPVGNSSATISAWINTTQHGEHYFVSWGSRIGCGPVSNEIALGVFGDNHLILESCGGNVRSSTVVNDGAWHHVAGVWYGSDVAALYVDGVDVTVNDCSSGCLPSIDVISSGHLNIGQLVQEGFNFSGLVDEVQIFNRALSASEIHAIFAAGSAGVCKTTPTPSCTAQVQPLINADGSSVFNVRRGVIPVKFTLSCDGNPTCELPSATIAVTRTASGIIGQVNESVYIGPSDSGSNFRIDGCQYHYNLTSNTLGVGTYRVDILINGQVVGSATFQLN